MKNYNVSDEPVTKVAVDIDDIKNGEKYTYMRYMEIYRTSKNTWCGNDKNFSAVVLLHKSLNA